MTQANSSWATFDFETVAAGFETRIANGMYEPAEAEAIRYLIHRVRELAEALRAIGRADIDRDYGSVGMGYQIAEDALAEHEAENPEKIEHKGNEAR